MTRQLPPAVQAIGRALAADAGTYLQSTIREPSVTCAVCAAPVRQAVLLGDRADRLAGSPDVHDVGHPDLGFGQDGRAPAEARVDDDVGVRGELARVQAPGGAVARRSASTWVYAAVWATVV